MKDNVVPSRFTWCLESPIQFSLQATTKSTKTTTTKPSTSAVTCSSLDSVDESQTFQNAYADELQQDGDAMIEKLEEKMLSEDLKQKLLSSERKLEAENRIIALENETTLMGGRCHQGNPNGLTRKERV